MAKKAAAKAKKTIKKKGAKPVRPAARPKKAKAVKPKRTKAPAAKPKSKKAVAAKKKAAVKKPIVARGKKFVVKKSSAKQHKPLTTKAKAPAATKKEAPKAAAAKPLPPAPKAAIKAVPPAVPKPAPVPTPAPAPPRPVAIKKRPLKEKFQIEFQVRSTPSALYDMLLSPSGFSEWYCDDVDVRGEEYTFKWGNEEEKAMIIGQRQNEVTRFHRVDDEDEESYFEFRIKIDPITDEVALIVTDHCWPDETENSKALWASQIANLARVLGA